MRTTFLSKNQTFSNAFVSILDWGFNQPFASHKKSSNWESRNITYEKNERDCFFHNQGHQSPVQLRMKNMNMKWLIQRSLSVSSETSLKTVSRCMCGHKLVKDVRNQRQQQQHPPLCLQSDWTRLFSFISFLFQWTKINLTNGLYQANRCNIF